MAAISCTFSPPKKFQKSLPPPPTPFDHLRSFLSSAFKHPMLKELRHTSSGIQADVSLKMTSQNLLEGIADTMFKFVNPPVKIQGNHAPVDEIGEAVEVSVTEGEVPKDFPQGVYIRTGPNLYFADKTTANTLLGDVAFSWFEGDGMVHATYFKRGDKEGKWSLSYKNRYIESETFLMEKEKNKVLFLPAAKGKPPAVILAFFLNLLRYGKVAKESNNTNVFKHGGKVYTIAENHLPHEIDISNLDTVGVWDVNGTWDRAFTNHPKRVPGTGELVIMGIDINKPHNVLGVISADGKKLVHKADLKFSTGTLIHELGVTENYNIIMDYPLRIGLERLFADNTFIGYDKSGKSRIGVMPRYGDAESILWFDVKNHCSFHIINTFEDGYEVVIIGCRTSGSILPGPDHKVDETNWYKRAYMKPPSDDVEGFDPNIDGVIFSCPYEWRLNIDTGRVKERFLTKSDVSMDFPTINNDYLGLKNKEAYIQVVDSVRSADTGMPFFNMFAKLYFAEKDAGNEEIIKVEYHVLEDGHFCSGLQFVPHPEGIDEDDGWVVCYVHDNNTDVSKVYIVDAKWFTEEPVTKITLPKRVPYGFHGTFVLNEMVTELSVRSKSLLAFHRFLCMSIANKSVQ